MNKIYLIMLLLITFSVARAINVTGVEAVPNMTEINATVNISANVFSEISIASSGFSVEYPNNSTEFFAANIFSDYTSSYLPSPFPYNITSIANTYNFTLDCYDFSDESKCRVFLYNLEGSCTNVTFDDAPNASAPDLDIGVLACVNETASGYSVNLTRWGYDASNNVKVRFCLNSTYGVANCSDWIIDNSGCNPTSNCKVIQNKVVDFNKTLFGAYYLNAFNKTYMFGTHYVTFFANDSEGNVNDTEKTFFSIGENLPPRFLSWSIEPDTCNALDKVIIQSSIFDESKITSVYLTVIGPENITLQMSEKDKNNYIVNFYPPYEGVYLVNLTAKDIFNNVNSTFVGQILAMKPILPPKAEACKNISSLGLLTSQNVLSKSKLLALTELSYYCTKNIIGLWGYDFQLSLKHQNGTVVMIDDVSVIYGKEPGISTNIYVTKKIVLLPDVTGDENLVLYLKIWRGN